MKSPTALTQASRNRRPVRSAAPTRTVVLLRARCIVIAAGLLQATDCDFLEGHHVVFAWLWRPNQPFTGLGPVRARNGSTVVPPPSL
jgi:hypothetical protein